jgi:epoxyqueuosine reductase QueG
VTWNPDPAQTALTPAVSGNQINGLDECEPRRPTPVYWHNPAKIPHGAMQRWIVDRFNAVPAFAAVYGPDAPRGPRRLEPPAETRVERTAPEWTTAIKAHALAHEADQVGIARLDPNWVFEGYDLALPFVVVLAVAMDHGRLATAPATPENTASQVEVADQYNRGARAAKALAAFIRAQGFAAEPHAGPWAGAMTLVPAAIAAGLGELGKHGSIINRAFGSSFRLAAVSTDMPLEVDRPDIFGADDFCLACQVCARACPPDAISHAKRQVRGVEKWYVDFDKCLPYFNETYGCGICIAVCPWSTPGTAPRLAERMTARRARK